MKKSVGQSGRLQDLKVLHCSQIAIALREKALMLKKASGMQMYNTQFAKKEDRLREIAKIQIRSGQFRDYCETLFELGDYDKALSFAPAVGIEYWQELAERRTRLLEEQQKIEEAALSALVSN